MARSIAHDSRRATVAAGAVVFLLTLALFLPTLWCDFVAWDDDIEIYKNPHIRELSWASLTWAFTDFAYVRRYIPLDWLSWILNYKASELLTGNGLTPWTYHLGNALLHGGSAAMVFYIIRRTLRAVPRFAALDSSALIGISALAALFWSTHPLRVEAVTWANSRIHDQALFLLLASFLAYLRAHDPHPENVAGRRRRVWLGLSSLAFLGSLLCYGTGLALPFVLLVVDIAMLRRLPRDWRWRDLLALVLEKAPMILAAALWLGITLYAASRASGLWTPPPTLAEVGMLERAMRGFYIWARFLWKPFLPFGLSPVYTTLYQMQPLAAPFVGSAAAVIGITVAAFALRRRVPAFLALWLCHLAILVPVLGVNERVHYPSDRYSYVQGIVLSIALAMLACVAWPRIRDRSARLAAAAGAAAVIVTCAALTLEQSAVWTDSETLFRHMLAHLGKDSYRADIHRRLAIVYMENRRYDEGLHQADEALRIAPDSFSARRAKAWILLAAAEEQAAAGNQKAAAAIYRSAIAVLDDCLKTAQVAGVYSELAAAHLRLGEMPQAEAALLRAVSLSPQETQFRKQLLALYVITNNPAAARLAGDEVIRLDPALAPEVNHLLARVRPLDSNPSDGPSLKP